MHILQQSVCVVSALILDPQISLQRERPDTVQYAIELGVVMFFPPEPCQ